MSKNNWVENILKEIKTTLPIKLHNNISYSSVYPEYIEVFNSHNINYSIYITRDKDDLIYFISSGTRKSGGKPFSIKLVNSVCNYCVEKVNPETFLLKDNNLTSWLKLIKIEAKKYNDDTDTLISSCNFNDLKKHFDNRYGYTQGIPFTAWTLKRVYFSMYDKYQNQIVMSVPRNPCDEETMLNK